MRKSARCALATLMFALSWAGPRGAEAAEARRVVIFSIPGVTWEHVLAADTPVLDSLIRGGAVGAVSVRSGQRGTTPLRGYLTMGAGARAFAIRRVAPLRDDPQGQLAFNASDRFEGGTAAEALARRTGARVQGGLVHVAVPYLRAQDRRQLFGTQLGALGEALESAGVGRAVVAASDLSVAPRESQMRRSAVLALSDSSGHVDSGTVAGLLRTDADAPYGVTTDPDRFEAAVRAALDDSRVALLDPGETLRADEYALHASPVRAERLRRLAIEKADALLGRVVPLLHADDLLYVISPSSPFVEPRDHLTPIVAFGSGRGWLTSPATRREGIVALTDVAQTVLADLGVRAPDDIRGTRIRAVAAGAGSRTARLVAYDRESLFREKFIPIATAMVIGLLAFVAVLSFLVFLSGWNWGRGPLRILAYASLALPPAALILRAAGLTTMSTGPAAVALLGLTAVFVALAFAVPGPRWAAAVVLMLFSCVLLAADLLAGAPLSLSGVFGYSPTVGGRFYGNGNLGFAILFATGILGLTGLADLLGHYRAPLWAGVGLVLLVAIEGLPPFGADLGGVLAGVPAIAVTWLLARGRRIRWRTIFAFGVATLAMGTLAVLIDALRPSDVQTHLGRFGSQVASGGWTAAWTVIRRKGLENLGLLDSTVWLYTIPIAVSVLALLLWRPRGVLAERLPKHPLLRAGLIGSLVAGVAGFAVNDSGIIIPAMVMVHVVPFFVLIGLQPPGRAPA